MKIQQHDGVVVEATVISEGFAKRWEMEEFHGRERERPGAWVRNPPSPHYI